MLRVWFGERPNAVYNTSIYFKNKYEDEWITNDFARAAKGSDNSFLLITRNYPPNLPVSVDEIYELTGKKSKRFKPIGEQCFQLFHLPTICMGPRESRGWERWRIRPFQGSGH